MSSLLLIARAELRIRWLSILLIGVLGGLVGTTVVCATTLARRTATADERLSAATHADDVRSLIFGGTPETTRLIGRQAIDRPEVAEGRIALGGVARLDIPGVVYTSVMEGPQDWGTDVLSPVLSEGRLPDPDRPDEVVVNEAAIHSRPELDVGDRLTLHFLTADEFPDFSATNPLQGRAGDQEVTLVGLVRQPGAPEDLPIMIGTPALTQAQPVGMGVLGAALVRLHPGADVRRYTDAIHGASDAGARPEALAEFPAMSVTATAAQARVATETTTGVLVTGLLVLAGVAALVGAGAVLQASVRHHAATESAQRAERAMGFTTGQRTQARLVAALPALLLTAAVTLAAGLATAGLEPPGGLRLVEPSPGYAPNLAIIGLTTVVAPLVVALAFVFGASRAIRRATRRDIREAPLVGRVAAIGGPPPTVLGLRFALERSAGPAGVSARAAMATVAAAVAGTLAALTFAASLQRLVDTPVRYGFPSHVVIADAEREVGETYAGDDRFSDVVEGSSADLLLDGRSTTGTARTALRGTLEWELAAGRPPATTEEIVLGTRQAEDLDKGVGDVVTAVGRDGRDHPLAVVGVGVVPNYSGNGLGRSAGLTPEALDRVAVAQPFGELALTIGPSGSVDVVTAELATKFELEERALPRDVANLRDIDRVPVLLAVFLALLGSVTLAHAVTMTARRRRADLATARALGFTGGQAATSVVVMALTIGVTGAVLGVPIGLAFGSTIWRLVAEGAAVLGDADVRWLLVLGLVPATALLALALSVRPALQVGRHATAPGLRAE